MAKDVLTDEEIDALDSGCLHWMAPRGRESVREFARLLEARILAAAEPAIRADERERCAKVCEPFNFDRPDDWTEYAKAKAECATAIRQLGAGSKGDDRG